MSSKQKNKNNTSLSTVVEKGNIESIWTEEHLEKVRTMYAPDLTPTEFDIFVGMGKSLGANPFNREIYAVKYGSKDAQIFLGRDFYRRKAQEQEDYNGHVVDAVYSCDTFKVTDGKPEHTYNLVDREDSESKILGAYCVVWKEGIRPTYKFVRFKEYYDGAYKIKSDGTRERKTNSRNQPRGLNLWDTKPKTMIEKVAEAQTLRMAFQGVFAGTYDESEAWTEDGIRKEYSESGDVEVSKHPEHREPLHNVVNDTEEDVEDADFETLEHTEEPPDAFDYDTDNTETPPEPPKRGTKKSGKSEE